MKSNLNEEKQYQLKMMMPYAICSGIKEREATVFKNTIGGSRIGQMIKFKAPCTIVFSDDDKTREHPMVTEHATHLKGKINCLEYEMQDSCYYNRVFIYQTVYKYSSYYGIVFYNDADKKSLHLYNIEYDLTKLVYSIQRVILANTREAA